MDRDEERRRRAEARRSRAVLRWTSLRGAEEELQPVRGEEAMSLVTRLTREAWAAAGRPIPDYDRSEAPVRFVPRRDDGARRDD